MERQLQRLKEPRVLDRETENKVNFMAFIIQRFATSFKMSGPKAYLYLKQYGGLDYINDCWWALHIDNPYWAVKDIYKVCRSNGGMR
jgi:hypothetical protein